MINLVLFGPPGAGKGTQSMKIIEKYELIHLSTGELFRKHIGEGTYMGKLAKKFIDEGNLVPDDVVIKMVEIKIDSHKGANGFIFDGFPRTVAQAEELDEMLKMRDLEISLMLALEVDDNELRTRLKLRGETSGRADDQSIQKINNRIAVYKAKTLPVADYYRRQSKYKGIRGVGYIDGIFNEISMFIDLKK